MKYLKCPICPGFHIVEENNQFECNISSRLVGIYEVRDSGVFQIGRREVIDLAKPSENPPISIGG